MAPRKNMSAIKPKPDFTNGMLFCVWSSTITYNYPGIIKRLI